jgi:uncharacterized membrane protein YvbJ
MAYCSNCGTKLEENAKFCLACGTPTEQTENNINATSFESTTPAPAKASGNLNVAQLVWSIINLVVCCMPLGIAGLVMTIFAKDASTAEEEAKKLKTAKTCNLIGTIGSAVFYVLYFAFILILALSGVTA